MSDTKIFTVDKFLGLNESADGTTELKLGEAARAENFYITDNYNLKTRPGVSFVAHCADKIITFASGNINGRPWLMYAYMFDTNLNVMAKYTPGNVNGVSISAVSNLHPVKVCYLGEKICLLARSAYSQRLESIAFAIKDGEFLFSGTEIYDPIVITSASPSGGGTALEPINLASEDCRLQYNGDGSSCTYVLPSYIQFVNRVLVDNETIKGDAYSYDRGTHTCTFSSPPPRGDNNVQFHCYIDADEDLTAAREKFYNMKYCEAFNGATDSRLFFYGDGTNVCYYTGVPAFGSGLYVPVGNEIAADTSPGPITGMARHYSKLIGFKPDGAFTLTYEPVLLADGTTIAGFSMRAASREFGNEMDGQVQTINNCPRTVCGGHLYEWRNASSYQDERYAKRISDKISKTLASADPSKIVTCDDNARQTYYMFLNDSAGTVLVNQYNLDTWTTYTGDVFKDVRFAAVYDGDVMFASSTNVLRFNFASTYDDKVEVGGLDIRESVPIQAVWESGFMSFGADFRRKYSSHIWLSLLPEVGSDLEITAQTDKRSDYIAKTAGYNLLSFANIDFSNFSFLTNYAPKIKRIQLKIKKFVYYKLILKVKKPGARATVLGYDQQIRYSSNVK